MFDLAQVPVAILAGGLGSRLRSAVPDRQKVVADVSGHPFLHYLLLQLHDAGLRRAVLCTGYLGSQVTSLLAAPPAMEISVSEEPEPLGTAGALRFALPQLTGEHVLVMNGDSFCETSLRTFAQNHHTERSNATILLASVPDSSRFGRVSADAAGFVRSFEEKGKAGPGLINAGIYLIKRELLSEIPESGACSLEREIFPKWVERGVLRAFAADVTRFIDIGTPESYAEAQKIFSKKEGSKK